MRIGIFACLTISQAGAQSFNEILGRPSDHAVTISALFSEVVEVKFEYGTEPGNWQSTTPLTTSLPDAPVVQEFQPLQANTRYFYRTVYRIPGATTFQHGPIRTFHTQRATGSIFSFCVEADEHLYDKKGIPSLYQICLNNQALDSADFMLSLGDTFGDDHTPLETTSEDMQALHLDYRQYLGAVCHSMPFFFCLGNHEGETGYWLDQTPPENIAVYGTQWRKYYYPNPVPNEFYSGNTTQEPYGIGYPENYYAFTWGDALFVILDVYRDCDVDEKPKNWDWTLGEMQYNWLKNTLENSTAIHKFVFAHHNRGQGRGGILPARGYEWGGYGNNGNGDWEFDQMRPGWAMPIHQLMVENGVNIFFQGHDHLYAVEEMDGLVYQEVPMPSDTSYQIGVLANADAYTGLTLDGSGHLRVTVEPSCVTVDYVAAYLPEDTLGGHHNREIRHTYQVGACATSTTDQLANNTSSLHIYPNPAKNSLTVELLAASESGRAVELFNSLGQMVVSTILPAGSTTCTLDLHGLHPGIFTVRCAGDGSIPMARVLVLK
ncbi:MAG: metallophosphoesterase [Saprospiraceae bacterium]|nr:metallophosphoesterase [Saprospiraceae bacterium]